MSAEPNRVVAYLGVLLAMAMGALDSTIVTTALPTIAGDLDGGNSANWVMTAYLLTSALSTPVWGKASDSLGRRRLLMVSVVAFLVTSVLCGLSTSMPMLIAVRAVQGVAAGGLMALGSAASGDLFSPRERGRYSGYSAAVFGGTTVVGPVLGGVLTDTLGWQAIFYINVPLGLASLALVLRHFHVPVVRRRFHVDALGIALITLAVLSALLLLEFGGKSFEWISAAALALAGLAAMGVVLFVWWERRAPYPLVPLTLFGHRTYRLATAIGSMGSWAQMTVVFLLPVYLQLVQGVPASLAGATVIPMTLALVLSSLVSGQVVSRTGHYKPIVVAGSLAAVLGFTMFSLLGRNDSLWWIVLASVLAGLGIGGVNNVASLAAQNAVPLSDLGVATSTLSLFRSLGQTAATAVAGAVATITFTSLAASRFGDQDQQELLSLRASGSPDALDQLASTDPSLYERLVGLIDTATGAAFAVGLVAMAVALACAVRIPELGLRSTRQPEAAPPD